MAYDVGDTAVISAVYRTTLGVLYDPANVWGRFTDPSGNITTYQFGVDVELVKDAVGLYHFNIAVDEAGTWTYSFFTTGAGQTADYGFFTAAAPLAVGAGVSFALPLPYL